MSKPCGDCGYKPCRCSPVAPAPTLKAVPPVDDFETVAYVAAALVGLWEVHGELCACADCASLRRALKRAVRA